MDTFVIISNELEEVKGVTWGSTQGLGHLGLQDDQGGLVVPRHLLVKWIIKKANFPKRSHLLLCRALEQAAAELGRRSAGIES